MVLPVPFSLLSLLRYEAPVDALDFLHFLLVEGRKLTNESFLHRRTNSSFCLQPLYRSPSYFGDILNRVFFTCRIDLDKYLQINFGPERTPAGIISVFVSSPITHDRSHYISSLVGKLRIQRSALRIFMREGYIRIFLVLQGIIESFIVLLSDLKVPK